ncbi:MAG: hypothetical protein LBH01_01200 [Verrucomicrobiales bacterium]|jgi:hypothetical protein|nr:hypothetical protein [Verrucomicrobiales bacterium]
MKLVFDWRWMGVIWTVLLLGQATASAEVYQIRDIRRYISPARDNIGPWEELITEQIDEKTKAKKKERTWVFVPYLEVKVEVKRLVFTEGQDYKIYCFDKDRQIIGEPLLPSNPSEKGRNTQKFPVKFETGQVYSLYFKIPESLRKQAASLTYLVVVGDKNEVAVKFYPERGDSPEFYEFWEKDVYLKPKQKDVTGKPKMEPVMQHMVLTKNPKQPRITLFFCPPEGVTDASELNGVIAYCMLGDGAENLVRKIQRQDNDDGLNYLREFAKQQKLGLLMWGSTRLWDPQKNYTEYERKQYKELDESFEAVASAWEEGLLYFHNTYGIPKDYLLLEGFSGSAQWAHRLAMRKPEYFLAVHIHIPSSFDKPRVEASKILWCVTTGELEGGYESSKTFYADCRALNFPIIYKAIPKLGHQDSVIAYDFRDRFFEFALSLREKRKAYDGQSKDQLDAPKINGPWPEEFRNAPYVGDIINQSLYPSSEADMVPESMRVYLPTKALADAWNQSQP